MDAELGRFVGADGGELVVTERMLYEVDAAVQPGLAAFAAFLDEMEEAEEALTPHYEWSEGRRARAEGRA